MINIKGAEWTRRTPVLWSVVVFKPQEKVADNDSWLDSPGNSIIATLQPQLLFLDSYLNLKFSFVAWNVSYKLFHLIPLLLLPLNSSSFRGLLSEISPEHSMNGRSVERCFSKSLDILPPGEMISLNLISTDTSAFKVPSWTQSEKMVLPHPPTENWKAIMKVLPLN